MRLTTLTQILCFILITFTTFLTGQHDASAKPNILFISVDDLRPQLNRYRKKMMRTPNIDRLAERGVLFE